MAPATRRVCVSCCMGQTIRFPPARRYRAANRSRTADAHGRGGLSATDRRSHMFLASSHGDFLAGRYIMSRRQEAELLERAPVFPVVNSASYGAYVKSSPRTYGDFVS